MPRWHAFSRPVTYENLGQRAFPPQRDADAGRPDLRLRYATDFSDALTDGKHRHDPDYIVSDSKLSKFDTTGKLKYVLVQKRSVISRMTTRRSSNNRTSPP